MRDFEEKRSGNGARESKARPPLNPDRNPTKEKGRIREPQNSHAEPMVLTPEKMNPKNGRRPITSTDVAAGKERTGTVTDGEAG